MFDQIKHDQILREKDDYQKIKEAKLKIINWILRGWD